MKGMERMRRLEETTYLSGELHQRARPPGILTAGSPLTPSYLNVLMEFTCSKRQQVTRAASRRDMYSHLTTNDLDPVMWYVLTRHVIYSHLTTNDLETCDHVIMYSLLTSKNNGRVIFMFQRVGYVDKLLSKWENTTNVYWNLILKNPISVQFWGDLTQFGVNSDIPH